MIDSKDISVVIQGPVSKDKNGKNLTKICCESVRKFLPESEIILSTWENEDVQGLDFDKIIFNEDPGANDFFDPPFKKNIKLNIDRQILSTKNGIKIAERKYVLKLRSEGHIENLNFIKFFEMNYLRMDEHKYFSQRVVAICSSRYFNNVFCINDFNFFGEKEDILDLWDIPLMKDKFPNKILNTLYHLNAHKYLYTEWLKKHTDFKFENISDCSEENFELYKKTLLNNFILTGLTEFGVVSDKYGKLPNLRNEYYEWQYTDWQLLYKEYLDENYKVKYSPYWFFKSLYSIYLNRKNLINIRRIKKLEFIKQEDMCIIIQGHIESGETDKEKLTKRAVISARKFFPGVKIILSTWEGSDCSDLDVDEIVYSKDPGPINVNLLGNTNRQIVGRINGLKKSDKKYTLIMRSDSQIINANFMGAFIKYKTHKYSDYHFLKERVVICSMGPLYQRLYYHICDWYMFGLTEDLIKIYDIPLFVDNEKQEKTRYNDSAIEQTPHSWIMMNFVEKFMDTGYKTTQVGNEKIIEEYQKVILENFVTLGFHNLYGIRNNKKPYLREKLLERRKSSMLAKRLLLSHEIEDWLKLYNKHYKENEALKYRTGWQLAQFIMFYETKIKKYSN